MLSRKFTRGAGYVLVALMLCMAMMLVGCTQRPEKNPYLIEKFTEIDEALQDVQKIRRELVILQDDIKYFGEELAKVRTLNGGLTTEEAEKLTSFTQKYAEFEKLTADLERLKSEIASVDRKVVASSGSTSSASSAPAPTPKSSPAPAKSATASSSPSRTTASAATGTASRGRYYNVQSGESLSSIARKNGITIQALASANRLPANSQLVAGQRIWVP